MKSIVICCAIAISLEFVASIPYSTDSQRYSGYKAKPSLEPPYQVNSRRPYYPNQQYNSGAYRAPTPQVQLEQKAPNINREHYFPLQQQRYQPKGPPQQAEINNANYFNQQNAANAYANRQIQEIRREFPQNAVPSFPEPAQITNPETFVPAIPVIPSVPQYTPLPSGKLWTKVEYNRPAVPTQFKEVELPIIQPTPPVKYASVRKVNDVDRFLARAADPVEQIPPPRRPERPKRPLVDIFLSRPNIRNVLATTKHKKRYLVIHPDGTVEHVDKIENVAERHPNYVLVNAGDIDTNLQRQKPVTATPTPQSPSPGNWLTKNLDNIDHHTLTTVPTDKETLDKNSPLPGYFLTKKLENKDHHTLTTVSTDKEILNNNSPSPGYFLTKTLDNTDHHTLITVPTDKDNSPVEIKVPAQVAPLPVQSPLEEHYGIPEPSVIAPETTVAEVEPAQVAPLPVQSPLEEHYGIPEPSVIAPETAVAEVEPAQVAPLPVQSPLEENYIIPEPSVIAPKIAVAEVEPAQVASLPVQSPLEEHYGIPEPSVIAPETAVAEVVFPPTDLIETITHVSQINPSKITIKKEVLPPNNADNISQSEPISAVHETEVSPSSSLTNTPKNELVNIESSLHEIVNKVAIDNPDTLEETIVPTNAPIDEPPASNAASSVLQDYIKELAFVEEFLIKTEEELSVPENKTVNHDDSCTTVKHINNQQPTDDPEVLDSFEEIISKLNEQVSDKNSQLTLPSDNEVPNLGDLDISKVHAKPAVWFKTTDPDVLQKLADKDKGLDVVYFFQIHNQPKIEKDIKTTIHPNGTIVEDTIKTTWAFEGDDEPTITKSTKIILPEDL